MRFVLLLALLFVSLFTSSCNQVGLGIQSAVSNLITAPYRGIRDAISDAQYENILETTEERKLVQKEISETGCDGKFSLKISTKADDTFSILRDEVRKNVCSSKAWGSCSVLECPCSLLCPETFELFNRTEKMEDLTKEENSLSFRNTLFPKFTNAPEHVMTHGFCWGHTSVTSKFNRLTFFGPKTNPPFDNKSTDPEEQNKLIDYYKAQIEKVLDNEVADFPGIKDLKELSSIPGLEEYLYDRMGEIWADNAMTFQGLSVAMQSSSGDREENKKFFDDVKNKLDNYQQPKIVFTQKDDSFATDTTLVSHYYEMDGKTILCLRDNNHPPQTNYECKNKMFMKDDGTIEYDDHYDGDNLDIGGVAIAHNDNRETVAQVDALHEKCQDDYGCDD